VPFTASHQSSEEPEPRYALHPATDEEEGEPEPRPTDNEGEEQFSPLPPLEEEPRADNTAGSGQPLGSCNSEYLRQFEALFGRKVFTPNVAGSAMGIVGPED
jgi:hypothetical protein